jgi:coniferyl-aldehyde dehydrogenase
MREILDKQRHAFQTSPAPTARERKASLARLADALRKHQDALITAAAADFGHRARQDTILGDLFPTFSSIKHLDTHLSGWMKPEKRSVPLHFKPARAWIEYQPLGMVGVISPWNYPIGLALVPLATALAAGNRVMLKPSELTPRTSDLLTTLLAEVFPPEQVAVVNGGAETGSTFAGLPFDLICFTGSTAVGKLVMKAASENLTPVILELGGKSPAIVDADYPLEHAARSIAHGKLANAGQTCIAPDYALIPEESADAFVELLRRQVDQLYPQWEKNNDFGAIVSARHHERLTRLVDDARTRGAAVIPAGQGETPGGPPDNQVGKGSPGAGIGKTGIGSKERDAASTADSRKFPPTILRGVTDDMLVMQEEIFGPILPVMTYRSLDDAIRYVNAHHRPLAIYLYSHSNAHQQQVLSGTTSGGVTINDTMLHCLTDSLPFGGIGSSGMGCYHGIEGFRNFSHRKAVFHQSRLNFADLLRPPFGEKFDRIVRHLLR